jgi:hypothetical protein
MYPVASTHAAYVSSSIHSCSHVYVIALCLVINIPTVVGWEAEIPSRHCRWRYPGAQSDSRILAGVWHAIGSLRDQILHQVIVIRSRMIHSPHDAYPYRYSADCTTHTNAPTFSPADANGQSRHTEREVGGQFAILPTPSPTPAPDVITGQAMLPHQVRDTTFI